ncbi:MAG: tRNA (adenosine(37)-N6)-threonylcarbamoyltransferase complex dimerization subunit type 1 TsaB [Bacteroidetes bacterium]|nr:MAG: tRNA (adenosine(37)-N6)-threonylcarbamoyltransferase complex dimerization subunit type 1 TsaB [Bacteroidota bacterium]TAG89579.1 MAG: tRNA (adenosine(37)-N6)-threonylcarbamoyltransferase complex dimerization subunit type 1 TsaB [Bacteroidota bacterium]
MSYILSFETSTQVCSVALHQAGNLVASSEIHTSQSHSEKLTLLAQQILENAKINLEDVEAIAISKGPGSYTGLRIGVSTAKGLCFALQKPLISISTLKIMALEASNFIFDNQILICPMIDARRMEVYCAIFDVNLNEKLPINAAIITEKSFENILSNQKIFFMGDGAEKCKTTFSFSANAVFPRTEMKYPHAKNMGKLAFEKFNQKKFENVAYFEPFYLKEFVGKKLNES